MSQIASAASQHAVWAYILARIASVATLSALPQAGYVATVDVRGRVSVASHLADRSLGFVGDESDMSDLGIVRTSGAANAAPTTRGSLC